jgi:hypothetical protein
MNTLLSNPSIKDDDNEDLTQEKVCNDKTEQPCSVPWLRAETLQLQLESQRPRRGSSGREGKRIWSSCFTSVLDDGYILLNFFWSGLWKRIRARTVSSSNRIRDLTASIVPFTPSISDRLGKNHRRCHGKAIWRETLCHAGKLEMISRSIIYLLSTHSAATQNVVLCLPVAWFPQPGGIRDKVWGYAWKRIFYNEELAHSNQGTKL